MRKLLAALLLWPFLAAAQPGNFPPLIGARGTSNPTNCSIGQLFFRTDASAGSNIYGCTAANTWTAQGSSSVAFPLTVTGGTLGGIPYFSGTTTLSASALLTSGSVMVGGGAGASPATVSGVTAQIAAAKSLGTPYILAKSGIPFVILGGASSTMGNNGALSGIVSLPNTYPDAYVWLPAGSIAAGVPASAGWYYAIFSAANAATIYNNQPGSTFPVTVPGSPTPFVTTGPGAFTPDTGEVFLPLINVPANAMGANGMVTTQFAATSTATATNTIRLRFSGTGGTTILSQVTTFSASANVYSGQMANRGKTNSQGTQILQPEVALSSGNNVVSAIDTTAATTLVLSGQRTGAASFIVFESLNFVLFSDGT